MTLLLPVLLLLLLLLLLILDLLLIFSFYIITVIFSNIDNCVVVLNKKFVHIDRWLLI